MPSTSLRDCEPKLAEAYALGKIEFEHAHPGYTVNVTCTKRSTDEQQILYAQGRTTPGAIVTQLDGVTKLSKHNLAPVAKALDFVVAFHGKIVWNDEAAFILAASYFKKYGAKWGGDWPHFKDLPHIEVD